MEDKELQELFDAKRWQMENQRMQEEIASQTGHRTLVWPWWTGAAAVAAMLAIIFVAPMTHIAGTRRAVSAVAQAEAIPQIPVNETLPLVDTAHHVPTTPTVTLPMGTRRTVSAEALALATAEDEILATAEAVAQVDPMPEPSMPEPSTRRVHTRRSNRLADTRNVPAKPNVPALIAHYFNIPDSILYSSNIVIDLK